MYISRSCHHTDKGRPGGGVFERPEDVNLKLSLLAKALSPLASLINAILVQNTKALLSLSYLSYERNRKSSLFVLLRTRRLRRALRATVGVEKPETSRRRTHDSQIHSPKTDTFLVYFLRNFFREPACPLRSLLFPIPCSSCLVARAKKLETELKREEKEEERFPVRPLLSFPSARAAKGAHRDRRRRVTSADPPHLHLPKRNSKKTIF